MKAAQSSETMVSNHHNKQRNNQEIRNIKPVHKSTGTIMWWRYNSYADVGEMSLWNLGEGSG
jgi:hypothetical protein